MVTEANIQGMVAGDGFNSSLPGIVWLGATIVNQGEADRDFPKRLERTAANAPTLKEAA